MRRLIEKSGTGILALLISTAAMAETLTFHFVEGEVIDSKCEGVSYTACSQGREAWILGRGMSGTHRIDIRSRELSLRDVGRVCGIEWFSSDVTACLVDGVLYWSGELSAGEVLLGEWTDEFMPNVAADIGHELTHMLHGRKQERLR